MRPRTYSPDSPADRYVLLRGSAQPHLSFAVGSHHTETAGEEVREKGAHVGRR
jgi:hypothetical protein